MSFVIFFVILGLLIVVHEFGHFIAARKAGVKVEKFSIGFGPQFYKVKKGQTEYSLGLFPFGGYVKLAGDSLNECKGEQDEYFSKPVGKRFWIIFSGPLLNYMMGIICFWFIFMIGYPALTTKVGGLVDGFGAQSSGVQVNDQIIAVDGKPVEYWESLQAEIHKRRASEKVRVTILRSGRSLDVDITIQEKGLDDALGQKKKVGLLGITPHEDVVILKYTAAKSMWAAFVRTGEITTITLKGLWYMISGKIPFKDSVAGPLGIFMITSQAARLGFVAVLSLVAILSISLAIFNLLPLPILDGGHIFLLGVEKIRGRYISERTERIINRAGVSFIIFLALFVTYHDIVRIFGDRISGFIGK